MSNMPFYPTAFQSAEFSLPPFGKLPNGGSEDVSPSCTLSIKQLMFGT